MKFWRENSLSLTLFALFLLMLVGQIFTGFSVLNAELVEHGRAALGLFQYLSSGHFLEATFENWESEFLQMGLLVVLTIGLRQKGSSESKPLEQQDASDEDPRAHESEPSAPWPVRRGGVWLKIYQHSLSLALCALFLVSFAGHALGGLEEINVDNGQHGKPAMSLFSYVASSDFWFQSFQNWQSEFFSAFALIVLSIFLRQRGSSQSKPVAMPHSKTGKD